MVACTPAVNTDREEILFSSNVNVSDGQSSFCVKISSEVQLKIMICTEIEDREF